MSYVVTLSSGMQPTAAQLQLAYPDLAIKATDETVNNSATLQNDDELLLTVVANAKYRVDMHVIWNSNSTADWKWAWTTPTGLSGFFTATGFPAGSATLYTGALPWSGTGSNEGQGADVYTKFSGILITGANAGTLQFQWAQNTANASNTIVRAASFLSLLRMA